MYIYILYFSVLSTTGMSHLKKKKTVLQSTIVFHYAWLCNTPGVERTSLRNLTIIHSSFPNALVKVQMFSRSVFGV